LRTVLKFGDTLGRALLLMGISCCLSANEIMNLKVRDFKSGFDEKTKITTFKLRREKTKVDFVTFISPETSMAVQDYLNFRNKNIKTEEERRLPLLEKQKYIQILTTCLYAETYPMNF
jgi:hypothetical protein